MKRIVFLDYIRVLSCFLVMIVHASECYYVSPEATVDNPIALLENESDRIWVSIYDGFSRMAVPLFMIVSSYLLVPMGKKDTLWQFYRKRFKRILPPFFFFIVLYSTLPLLWGQLDYNTSIGDLSRIFLNFPTLAGHLWFIYPLISLYLFIPIISPWLEKATANEEKFFILLFLISTCIPYLNLVFGDVWGQCSWNDFHMLWYFSGYLGYLVLAHFIRVHFLWDVRKRILFGTISFFVGALLTIMSFYVQATVGKTHFIPNIEIGWEFCSINCVLMTLGAFLLFSCIKNHKPIFIVTELSKLSYGMYLVHMFWLFFCINIFRYTLCFDSYISIPCIAIATFFLSFLTIKIASLLPYSKWFVG